MRNSALCSYIFQVFWDHIVCMLFIFENRVPLTHALGGVNCSGIFHFH